MGDQSHIGNLGEQIATEFISRLGNVKLNDNDAALIARVSDRLANAAILAPGAPPSVVQSLQLQTDLDLASLENLAVAKELDAQTLLRQTVLDVTLASIKVLLKVAVA